MTAMTATAKVMLMTFFLSMIQMFLDCGSRVVRRYVSSGFLGAELVAVEIDQHAEKDNADNANDYRCGNFVHRFVDFVGLKSGAKIWCLRRMGSQNFPKLPISSDYFRFLQKKTDTFLCPSVVRHILLYMSIP